MTRLTAKSLSFPVLLSVLATLLTISAAFLKGGAMTLDHVRRVDRMVMDTTFSKHLRDDSLHHAQTDTAIARLNQSLLKESRENRDLLCYLAKYPAPMTATGICTRRVTP